MFILGTKDIELSSEFNRVLVEAKSQNLYQLYGILD